MLTVSLTWSKLLFVFLLKTEQKVLTCSKYKLLALSREIRTVAVYWPGLQEI